jgi:hypothetical protein
MLESNFEFNRSRFLETFSKDFLGFLEDNTIGLDQDGKLTYDRFKEIVNNYGAKFKSISYIRSTESGKGLTKRLWGFFYAHTVIPERARRFPEINQTILNRRYEKGINLD